VLKEGKIVISNVWTHT